MKKTIHLIVGPTASGKTDFSIQKAIELKCPIISADSRQVFKELEIGVAKPTIEQLDLVKHYFINHKSIFEDYNVGQYVIEARLLINQLFKDNEHLIVCGGTGLYINSLLNGIDVLPPKNEELRSKLASEIEVEGIDSVIEKHYSIISEDLKLSKNPQRIIRAIEIANNPPNTRFEIPNFEHQFDVKINYIQLERQALYKRINNRVDEMIKGGLEQEAKSFLQHKDLNALKTVGYSEWWDFFEGNCEHSFVVEKIKQHTRNYAKRQMTWFNHQLPKINSSY